MKTSTALFASIMELPEADRFEIAMAVLDESSPAAMNKDEINAEASRRQDELESGAVADVGFDQLVADLSHRPRSSAK